MLIVFTMPFCQPLFHRDDAYFAAFIATSIFACILPPRFAFSLLLRRAY